MIGRGENSPLYCSNGRAEANMAKETNGSEKRIERLKSPEQGGVRPDRSMTVRIWLIEALILVFGYTALVWQLYNIQIVDHDFYEQKAISQQMRGSIIEADRGVIYDRNGSTLAISASAETIQLSPRNIKDDAEAQLIARGLSEILGIDYDNVLKKTENRNLAYQLIQRKVEQDVADEVREFKQANGGLNAIEIVPDTKRYYSFGSFASQVIGFVGVDNEGLEGIESYYDSTLTGVEGKVVSLKNNAGTAMPFKFEKYYDAQDGQSLVLTIDQTVQQMLETHLARAIIEDDIQEKGVAIVMDVNTGAILGMATTDGCDLNEPRALTEEDYAELEGLEGDEYTAKLAELQYAHWRNKAISDTYQPGSIFKLITLSMALEEGVVDETSTFTCTGSTRVTGWAKPISCWRRSGHGTQTLQRALQNSCNPAFIAIGQRVGNERFYDYLQAYGFGQYTGIDLPGEAPGLIFDRSNFLSQQVSLAVASFGQTFNVTPIQMITAVSAVVNGGYLMKPYIVQEILNSDGTVAHATEPTVVRQVISEETSATMCRMMEAVVADGSGRNAQVAGYRIGGKTATSEKIGVADSEGKYDVSFMAVAPADDPEIALLVILDTPGESWPVSQRSGGYLAAPLAGDILEELLPYLGYEPEYSGEEMFGATVSAPDVRGVALDAAKNALKERGFENVRVVGDGETVTDQLPPGGVKVTTSSRIVLYTEGDAPSDTVTVPYVIGMSPEQANIALTNAGLYLQPSGALSATASTIRAVSQSVEGGTEVPRGTIVDVSFLDSNVGTM